MADKSKIESKYNIRVINFDAHGLPTFKENSKKGWVEFGDDNLYPQYLAELSQKSADHNAILKGKAEMIAGDGIIDENVTPEMAAFLKNAKSKSTVKDIIQKVAYDLALYGGFALNVIWSKDKTRIAQIEYIDFSKVRIALPDDDFIEDVDYYYLSRDWDNLRKDQNKPKIKQGFSKKYNGQVINGEPQGAPSQVFYYVEHRPGLEYYTLPDYVGAVNAIEIDYEMDNFHLNSIKNGFAPSLMISFIGSEPTEEEMDILYKQINKKYKGSANAGKIILTYSLNAENVPQITPIELNDSDERFDLLRGVVQQKILTGHRVTSPMIFGVKTPGQLGGRSEIIDAYDLYLKTVITPKQRKIEEVFNKLLIANEIQDELLIEKYNIYAPVNEEEGASGADVDKEAEARAQLRGSFGGVQGILQIQSSVSQGLTTRPSAIALLELIYGLTPEESARIVGDPQLKKVEDPIDDIITD